MRLIAFDFDGTLADTRPVLERVATDCAREWKIQPFRFAAFLDDMHHPLTVDFGWGLPADEQNRFCEQVFTRVDELMVSDPESRPAVFPWVFDMLNGLASADAELAIVSSRPRRSLCAVLRAFDLEAMFSLLVTNDDVLSLNLRPKPYPDSMNYLLQILGAAPGQTAMVGDTRMDIKLALGAGVLAIGVDWGFEDAKELLEAGAHHILGRTDAHAPAIISIMSTNPETAGAPARRTRP